MIKPRQRRWIVASAAVGGAAVAVTRLPQIYGPNGFLDGDESILALMALHLSRGSVALFFYGQSFGLAIVESATVALGFLLFGVSTPVVKWMMLGLWSCGAAAFALAVRRLAGDRAGLIAALLIVLCPAFGAWSTLARGYHIAAFAMAQLGLFQIVRMDRRKRPAPLSAVLLGATLGLLLETHAIWLLGLLPFAAWLALRRRSPLEGAWIAVGLAVPVVLLRLATLGRTSSFWSPNFLREPDPLRSLLLLPERVRVCFGGAYAYGASTDAGPAASAAGWLWGTALVLVLVRGVFLVTARRSAPVRFACLSSALLILGLSLLINPRAFGYRYLLPIAPPMILFISLEVAQLRRATGRGHPLKAAVAGLALVGGADLVEAPPRRAFATIERTSLSEEASIRTLVRDLETAGIHHVYCLHPTFQWNLIFYSRERIMARSFDPLDRVPDYPARVESALLSGQPVAIVGRPRQWPTVRPLLEREGLWPASTRISGGRFFWIPRPPVELVRRFGFEPPPPSPTSRTPLHGAKQE